MVSTLNENGKVTHAGQIPAAPIAPAIIKTVTVKVISRKQKGDRVQITLDLPLKEEKQIGVTTGLQYHVNFTEAL